MRAASTIVWSLLIAIGVVWAALRGTREAGVQAVTALPQNTLLLPGAFTPPTLAMHYVTPEGGVVAHARVDATAVSRVPVLPPLAAGAVLGSAPAAWGDIETGFLNAGVAAKLCREKVELTSITILAVRCYAAASTWQCSAAFAVPANSKPVSDLATPDGLRVAPSC